MAFFTVGIAGALAIFGLVALVSGKLTVGNRKVVVGAAARGLGLLALGPFAVLIILGVGLVLARGPEGALLFAADNTAAILVAGGVVGLGTAGLVYGIGGSLGVPIDDLKRKALHDRYDFDYDDEPNNRPGEPPSPPGTVYFRVHKRPVAGYVKRTDTSPPRAPHASAATRREPAR